MSDDRLPRLLVQAGIATEEQAERLLELIRQANREDWPDEAIRAMRDG